MKTVRLFVAWLLDDPVIAALSRIQKTLANSCDGVRWINPQQLHMTVKFLGDIPDSDVTRVSEAVDRGAAKCTPFTISLCGCGCFPPRGPVRIVWIGAEETTGTIIQSAKEIIGELVDVGFEPEPREWSPHITIGRVRDDRSHGGIRDAVEASSLETLHQSVQSVSVMSSVLSKQGPTYTAIHTTELG